MYCPQRVIFFLRQCQELPPPACKILFLRSRPHCNCATSLPRPQYGTPNLTDNFGYLGELDIYDVYDKRGVAVPTGNQARNGCYYQLMKSPGATGAGKNLRAPEYARKAARRLTAPMHQESPRSASIWARTRIFPNSKHGKIFFLQMN